MFVFLHMQGPILRVGNLIMGQQEIFFLGSTVRLKVQTVAMTGRNERHRP